MKTHPDGDEHNTGDQECPAGWCGTFNYPRPCEQAGCNGLVHADFGDENYDCDYWLYTKCDVCGEPE